MKCSTLNLRGLCKDCASSKGGIKQVLIGYYGDFTPEYAYETEDTEHNNPSRISGITVATGAKVFKYEFRKGTGSMTSTLNVDVTNGVNYVSTELILQFTKMETRKRIEMAVLSIEELVIFVQDSNGNWYYLGNDEPVVATAGTGQTGQAVGDGNFYNITFTDEANTWPLLVDDSVVTGLTVGNDCTE